MSASGDLRATFQARVWWLMVVYLGIVVINAALVVALFALRAAGVLDAPWATLASYAVGTGGMGAGSLAFKRPLENLFSTQDE